MSRKPFRVAADIGLVKQIFEYFHVRQVRHRMDGNTEIVIEHNGFPDVEVTREHRNGRLGAGNFDATLIDAILTPDPARQWPPPSASPDTWVWYFAERGRRGRRRARRRSWPPGQAALPLTACPRPATSCVAPMAAGWFDHRSTAPPATSSRRTGCPSVTSRVAVVGAAVT
jgi:hypothetical protein